MGDPITALLIGGAQHRGRKTVQSNRANSVPIKLYLGEEVYVRAGAVVAGMAEYKYSHTTEEDKQLKYRGKKYRPNTVPLKRDGVRVREAPPVPERITCSCCEDGSPCSGYGI